MVAPKYGSPERFSTNIAQGAASARSDKRREEILLLLVSNAGEDRMEGNTLFKDRRYNAALEKYSKAIHTLQKVSACDPIWLSWHCGSWRVWVGWAVGGARFVCHTLVPWVDNIELATGNVFFQKWSVSRKTFFAVRATAAVVYLKNSPGCARRVCGLRYFEPKTCQK